jgi:hypothetical protein
MGASCAHAHEPPAPLNEPRLLRTETAVTEVASLRRSQPRAESRIGRATFGPMANAPFPVPAHQTGRGDFPYRSTCGVVMRAAVLTGIGVLAVCAAVPALAAERRAASFVSPDPAYNAKWDECEALARSRGTPPGSTRYGDVIESCVRKACPSHLNPQNGPEGKHTRRGRAADQADRPCY